MENELLKIPATISQVRTLSDGSIRLTVDTQELRSDGKARLMELHNKLGWFIFSPTGNLGLEDVPDIPIEFEQKPPSQRLRNTLFIYYEKKGGKKEDFNLYYARYIEQIINKLKAKIHELENIN